MTDPIQQVFAKAEQEAGLRAALEEATSLLRQAKEQRERDQDQIADLSGAYRLRVASHVSDLEKLRAIKVEVNTLRRVPRWVRWFFGAA